MANKASISSFSDLEPGIYQIASPEDIKTDPVRVTLREEDHYWAEGKNINKGTRNDPDWHKQITMLHVNSDGLLVQANAIGAYVVSRIAEMDNGYIHVFAKGWHLNMDGILEVVQKSKEYNAATELMKAALKEVPRDNLKQEQTLAIVKSATEGTALALVEQLPATTKARVMGARLEVETHREALCRTKAENQVLKYFVKRAGGVMKRLPGKGEITIEFTRSMLMRKLDPGEVRKATDSLFGQEAPRPAAAPAEEPEEPDEHPTEDAEIVGEEVGAEAAAQAEETQPEAEPDALERTGQEAPPAESETPAKPETPAAAGNGGGGLPIDDGAAKKPVNGPRKCDQCPTTVSAAVVTYCQSQAGADRFGGAILCMDCQKKIKAAGTA